MLTMVFITGTGVYAVPVLYSALQLISQTRAEIPS